MIELLHATNNSFATPETAILPHPHLDKLINPPAIRTPVNEDDVRPFSKFAAELDGDSTSCAITLEGNTIDQSLINCTVIPGVDGEAHVSFYTAKIEDQNLIYFIQLLDQNGHPSHLIISHETQMSKTGAIATCPGNSDLLSNWITQSFDLSALFEMYYSGVLPGVTRDTTATGACFEAANLSQTPLTLRRGTEIAELNIIPQGGQIVLDMVERDGATYIKLGETEYSLEEIKTANKQAFETSVFDSHVDLIEAKVSLSELDGLIYTIPTPTPTPEIIPTLTPPPTYQPPTPLQTSEAIRADQEPRTVIGDVGEITINLGPNNHNVSIQRITTEGLRVPEVQKLILAVITGSIVEDSSDNATLMIDVLTLDNELQKFLHNVHATIHNFILERPGARLMSITTPMTLIPEQVLVEMNSDQIIDAERQLTYQIHYLTQDRERTIVIAQEGDVYSLITFDNDAIGNEVELSVMRQQDHSKDEHGTRVINNMMQDLGDFYKMDLALQTYEHQIVVPTDPTFVTGALSGLKILEAAKAVSDQTFTAYTYSNETSTLRAVQIPYGEESAGYYTGRMIYDVDLKQFLVEVKTYDLGESKTTTYWMPANLLDSSPK